MGEETGTKFSPTDGRILPPQLVTCEFRAVVATSCFSRFIEHDFRGFCGMASHEEKLALEKSVRRQ